MTKESRIGLLVGLVFIFAFGLMLSELTGSGQDPITASVTCEEPGSDPGQGAQSLPAQVGWRPPTPAQRVRSQRQSQTPRQPETRQNRRPPAEQIAIHRIVTGDTLIGLARKYYGPGSDELYQRIYEANRQIITDPNSLPVGKEIRIPPRPEGSPEPATRQGPRQQSQYIEYTVVEGDNLTRIARKVLGDDTRQTVQRIYEANIDRLPSPDRLVIGTRLRIPR